MSYGELYDEFLAVEDDLDLFSLEVDGVRIWERLRFHVFREILFEMGTWTKPHTEVEKTAANVLRGSYLWTRNLVYRNPFLADEHEFLFQGFERRKRQDDGLWWDLFCDPIYEGVDMDYLHVETPYLTAHRTPAKTETLRYLDLIEYSGTVQRELGLVRHGFSGTERAHLERAEDRIEDSFGVSLDVVDRARFRMLLRKSLKPAYQRFLKRVDPEIVFVVVSLVKDTFIEACKDLDIVTVELQHGILTDYEYGYPGYRTKETFPEYFFSFGDYWRDKIDFPIPEERVRPIGYPYFEHKRRSLDTHSDGRQVLFLSQGNIGEEFSKFALEFARRPEVDADDVVFKLHPGEEDRWRSDYPWLRDAPFEIVGEDGPGLYELFADSSAQVGVYTTAVYEGLGFGLRTYVVDLPGAKELSELCRAGHAEFVSTPEDLVTAMEGQSQQTVDASTFFEPNPLERFVEEVRRIATERDLSIDVSLADTGDGVAGSGPK